MKDRNFEIQVSLFRPPKDPEIFKLWQNAIPKRGIELTRKVNVCAKHFREDEIVWTRKIGEGHAQMEVCISSSNLQILCIM
jgi:hypothetical protein